MAKFVRDKIENIVGKKENAGHQHILVLPQCFQKAFSSRSLKVGIVWKRVKGADFNSLLAHTFSSSCGVEVKRERLVKAARTCISINVKCILNILCKKGA